MSKKAIKNDFGYIHENNKNFVYMSQGQRLEIISSEDAKFLYNEERIKYFILISSDKHEEQHFMKEFNVNENNLIIVKK